MQHAELAKAESRSEDHRHHRWKAHAINYIANAQKAPPTVGHTTNTSVAFHPFANPAAPSFTTALWCPASLTNHSITLAPDLLYDSDADRKCR